MPKKEDSYGTSESGNWNVAADYTKFKIMKQLYMADEYEIIATFGTSEMFEEFQIGEDIKSVARLKAIRRLLKSLQMVVNNTKFAVKKRDEETMKEYLKTLKKVENILPTLSKTKYNAKLRKSMIEIQEENFEKVLNHLVSLKSEINEPLNRADLIFTHFEDFDPKAAKEQIKAEMTGKG